VTRATLEYTPLYSGNLSYEEFQSIATPGGGDIALTNDHQKIFTASGDANIGRYSVDLTPLSSIATGASMNNVETDWSGRLYAAGLVNAGGSKVMVYRANGALTGTASLPDDMLLPATLRASGDGLRLLSLSDSRQGAACGSSIPRRLGSSQWRVHNVVQAAIERNDPIKRLVPTSCAERASCIQPEIDCSLFDF